MQGEEEEEQQQQQQRELCRSPARWAPPPRCCRGADGDPRPAPPPRGRAHHPPAPPLSPFFLSVGFCGCLGILGEIFYLSPPLTDGPGRGRRDALSEPRVFPRLPPAPNYRNPPPRRGHREPQRRDPRTPLRGTASRSEGTPPHRGAGSRSGGLGPPGTETPGPTPRNRGTASCSARTPATPSGAPGPPRAGSRSVGDPLYTGGGSLTPSAPDCGGGTAREEPPHPLGHREPQRRDPPIPGHREPQRRDHPPLRGAASRSGGTPASRGPPSAGGPPPPHRLAGGGAPHWRMLGMPAPLPSAA